MKIQKEPSRKYKGKSYFKYKINLPKGAVERAQMKAGDDVDITAEDSQIVLQKKLPKKQEFDGVRASLYAEALNEFPTSRLEDINIMKKRLQPQEGERILEIGAGSGFFSGHIAKHIGDNGRLTVADPSLDQLKSVKNLGAQNIDVIQFVQFGSPQVDLERHKVDAVWSFGAVHHISQKQKSFDNMSRILKKGGRVVICDVFSGSKLAEHFDDKVAKYCVTGHQVSFLSRSYAETLCFRAGFRPPMFYDEKIKWWFDSEKDIGTFIYKLHAMIKTTEKECLKGCREILGVGKHKGKYFLNWPMTTVTTEKA